MYVEFPVLEVVYYQLISFCISCCNSNKSIYKDANRWRYDLRHTISCCDDHFQYLLLYYRHLSSNGALIHHLGLNCRWPLQSDAFDVEDRTDSLIDANDAILEKVVCLQLIQ